MIVTNNVRDFRRSEMSIKKLIEELATISLRSHLTRFVGTGT